MLCVCDVTTGALGVVWFILWMLCASESPSQHGRINSSERQYIIDTLMTESVTSQQVSATDWTSYTLYVNGILCQRQQY